MLLYPPEPHIGPEDGFTSDNDIFGLREFGESLTNLVTNVEQPLVITLDGPWGSGKSTFAKQWAGLLRQRGLPVILFDAFANDHQDDAFIALSAEIMAQAQDLKGPKPLRKEFVATAKKVGSVLAPMAARTGFRLLTAGMVSGDDLTNMEEALKATSDDAGALLESAIGERLERAEQDRDSLDAFRDALKKLALGLSQKAAKGGEENPQGPLVFVIDELDRCRPPFALNVLERIKHLFSVEGVCFVLVTNFSQMEAAVCGTYGTETQARSYLDKFFNLRVSTPPYPTRGDQTRPNARYISYLWEIMGLETGDQYYDRSLINMVQRIAEKFQLHLRDLEKIAGHISIFLTATNANQIRVGPIVVGLASMRLLNRDLYNKAIDNSLSWKEVHEFFAPIADNKNESAELFMKWWRFATDEKALDSPWGRDLQNSLMKYSIDRDELLPILTHWMDRFQISRN